MSKTDFKKKHGGGKARAEFNRAVRAELPGGNELLDLMEKVSYLKNRKKLRGTIAETKALLGEIETELNYIRDEMVDAVRNKYEF